VISASGSRFPRATLQLPRKQNPLPAGSSAVVIPVGTSATSRVCFELSRGSLLRSISSRDSIISSPPLQSLNSKIVNSFVELNGSYTIPTGVYSRFIFRLSSIFDINRSLYMVYLPVELYFRYQPEYIHGLSSGWALFSIPTGVYTWFIFRLNTIFDTNRSIYMVYLPVELYFRYQPEYIHGLSSGWTLFAIPTGVYTWFIFQLNTLCDTNRSLFTDIKK
jgi:hypothetical protein